MRLLAVETPRVLPDFVACYSARLVEGDRRVQFAAGRECAARAMRQLGGGEPVDVPRGPAGEPVWPDGWSGSITHKDDYFCAAVARRSQALAIGIDAEQIIASDRASAIAPRVTLAQEAVVGGRSLPPGLRVSILFSIKEAVFKCLYPLVLKRFYYDALSVTTIDLAAGTFRSELTTSLSDRFPAGKILSGGIAIDASRVYTGIWLSPSHWEVTD